MLSTEAIRLLLGVSVSSLHTVSRAHTTQYRRMWVCANKRGFPGRPQGWGDWNRSAMWCFRTSLWVSLLFTQRWLWRKSREHVLECPAQLHILASFAFSHPWHQFLPTKRQVSDWSGSKTNSHPLPEPLHPGSSESCRPEDTSGRRWEGRGHSTAPELSARRHSRGFCSWSHDHPWGFPTHIIHSYRWGHPVKAPATIQEMMDLSNFYQHFPKCWTTDQARSHKNETLWHWKYISTPLNVISYRAFSIMRKMMEKSI